MWRILKRLELKRLELNRLPASQHISVTTGV
jgi:hypothetical protein